MINQTLDKYFTNLTFLSTLKLFALLLFPFGTPKYAPSVLSDVLVRGMSWVSVTYNNVAIKSK